MLDPYVRTLLPEALRPPEGYALDRALLTTFSLDLTALLVVPLAFSFHQLNTESGPTVVDPLALLEAVRRQAKRILLFGQAGRTSVSTSPPLLFGYLEGSIHEVTAPAAQDGGVFHPKIGVLRYVARDELTGEMAHPAKLQKSHSVRYRVLCSSRNLTFDRSWDTLLSLDGELAQDRQNAFATNRPLSEFVQSLTTMTLREVPRDTERLVKAIASELLRVRFEIPDGFDELEFYPMGHQGTASWPFKPSEKSLIISPFVSDGFISRYCDQSPGPVLVARKEALDAMSSCALGQLDAAHYLSTAAEDPPESDAPATDADTPPLPPTESLRGLHAKLFVLENGWKAHVWSGSANATDAAFTRNVEFLVRLTGSRKTCGVDSLLAPSDEKGQVRLGDLLEPYQRDGDAVVDTTAEALDQMANRIRDAIVAAKPEFHIRPDSDSTNRFGLAICRTAGDATAWPAGASVRCRPLSLKPSAEAEIPSPAADGWGWFAPLTTETITAFCVFQVQVHIGARTLSMGFVLNLPLHGAPPDREQKILLSILQNRERLLQFLLMLLADDEDPVLSLADDLVRLGRGGEAGSETGFDLPLLEPMLRTLDREPARLDQVARLVADLRATPEGRAMLTADFLEIWEPIWEARKGEKP